jgi:predicted transcriptional regulator
LERPGCSEGILDERQEGHEVHTMALIVNTRPHKRTRLHIVHDILAIAQPGARRTQILYRANLSYAQLSLYLNQLLTDGLVSVSLDRRYTTTKKGERFLRTYDAVEEARRTLLTGEQQMLSLLAAPKSRPKGP